MHFLELSPLSLLFLAFLLPAVLGAEPLSYICSNSGNYTSNGAYETNLNKSMSSLSYTVPRNKGFGYVSVGKDSDDRVYGLGLCRGDVSSSECKTCITDAKTQILQSCPNDKEAIIWYDYCLLKYSDEDFYGKIDTKYKVYMYNTQNVSDPETFNQRVKELLNDVATEAYDHSSKLYATGEQEFDGSDKLYGLAQCTRDLSRANCKECLNDAISDLPSCCDGKQGGRVLGGSCNIRYEIYSFVN